MRRGLVIGTLMLTALVVGCATIEQLAPPVDEAMLGGAIDDHALSVLTRGRQVYVTACARCHSPEAVTSYTADEWRTILPRMANEAGLEAEDQRAVDAYVMAVLAARTRD